MKNRPILVITMGYIIGILWGLYFSISIVFYYILIFLIFYIIKNNLKIKRKNKFKLVSFHRYSRYLKLVVNSKIIFIFIVSSIISNTVILFQNKKYENLYQNDENIQIIGIVISQKVEKQYYNLYKVSLLNSKNINFYIQVDKKIKELEYGDKITLQGEYKKPEERRNYGGYDDKQYLKTLKIVGRIKVSKVEIIAKKQNNIILQMANNINLKIKEKIDKTFNEEKANILKGILLGDTKNLQIEKEEFQKANISHILAVSGMHISYIIIGIQLIFKEIIGKKKSRIVTIFILILYTFITGFSPSVVRAVIMGVMAILAGILYRKNDFWNSIAISMLIILVYNPFFILNVGFQLSYLGTIGIGLFRKTILKILSNIKLKKIKDIISVTLSAQIMILPILLYHFNILGIYFLITNLLVSLIIGPIIIFGFFLVVLFFSKLSNIFIVPLNLLLEFLKIISKFNKLPFSKIYIPTPSIIFSFLYFIVIFCARYLYYIYNFEILTPTHKRIKNLIALSRYKFYQKKKRYFSYIIIVLIVFLSIYNIPKCLKIYFVDVGQGDCTFIVTPKNKTILIDGGGSITDNFDVGKKILLPYLLDRGYTSMDYIIISHFDEDHVRFYYIFITRNKSKKCHNRKTV